MTESDIKKEIDRVKKVVHGYIDGVLSGKILACRWVHLACERHLNDLRDGPARGLVFREDKAYHAVKFFSFLKLWKGKEYKGKEFILAPHRIFITWVLMGWYRTDGTRRFRKAYDEEARKSSKAEWIENLIPTPNGFKRMADIHPGDYVFGSSGNPVLVIGETEEMNGRECASVSLSTGESIVVSYDHLWEVNRSAEPESIRKAWTIEEDDLIRTIYPTGGLNAMQPVLPYRSRSAIGKRAECIGVKKENGIHNRSVAKLNVPRVFSMPDPPRVIDTKTISETLGHGSRQDLRYSVDVAPSIITEDNPLPIAAYTLGAWLGDGYSKGSRIITAYSDIAIIDRIEQDGYDVEENKYSSETCGVFTIGAFKRSDVCRRGHDKSQYRTRDGHCLLCNRIVEKARRGGKEIPENTVFSFSELLAQIGVRDNKHIPEEYLFASYNDRLSLLNGLMDTDGTVDKKGHCAFDNCNRRLVDDVHVLLSSLGIKATIQTRAAKIKGQYISDAYRVMFNPPDGIRVFHLKRKQERIQARTKKTRSDTRMIIAVDPVPSVPVKCIKVDSEDGIYLTGKGFIKTHNTTYLGGLAAYFFIADGEQAAEIYCAAVKRDQAKLVWDNIKNLTKDTGFAKNITYLAHTLTIDSTNSKCEPLSSDAKSLDGLDTHFASLDELHAHPTREVFDLIDDSVGARSNPLIFVITTAGFNQSGICYEMREYLTQILKGTIQDDSFFGIIFTLDTKKDWPDLKEKKEELKEGESYEDDWTNEDTWVKAAPALVGITESGKRFGLDINDIPIPGYMTKLEDMRDKCRIAKQMPSAQNNFLTKRLNVWTQQENRWLDLAQWDLNNVRPVTQESCLGRPCVGGIDLSAVSDMTVWVMLFRDAEDKDLIDILIRVWCPEARLYDTRNKYRSQYQSWKKQGYLTTTEGDAIDYDFVRGQIAGYTNKDGEYIPGDKDRFNIDSISVDRGFQGYEFSQKLDKELGGNDKSPKVIACGMGWVSMNGPCQELERLLLLKKLNHGGNPILRWMADNVSVKVNPTGGGKSPNKASSQGKIDGIVGILLGLDRLLRTPVSEGSAYAGKTYEEMKAMMSLS